MAAAAAPALPALSAFDKLICRSTLSLSRRLRPLARVASLDVTKKHVSIALSDRERGQAVPFGVFCRTASPGVDAKMISAALRHADKLDADDSLGIEAVVVGVAPDSEIAIEYAREFLKKQLLVPEDGSHSDECPFPDLSALLFYSETHGLRVALDNQIDFIESLKALPEKLEPRRMKRFAAAMSPKIEVDELLQDRSSRARLDSTDILQTVLEDMKRHS